MECVFVYYKIRAELFWYNIIDGNMVIFVKFFFLFEIERLYLPYYLAIKATATPISYCLVSSAFN